MRSLLVCGFTTLLLVSSSSAYAQTDAAKAQAITRYQEGVAFHERGKEEEAYLRFTEAYAVVQTPPILFNLARTEQLTNRKVAASQHFRAYLALPDHPRVTSELRAKAQGFLNELSAQLGHVKADVPAGSTVSVDGKDVAGGGVIDVEPGMHTIGARVGEQKGSTEIVVAGGQTVGARVLFEGAVPIVPVVVGPPPPLTEPNPIVLPPPVPEKEPYWNGRRTGGVVIAGIGVVGVVIGAVFGEERGSQTSDANTARTATTSGSKAPAGSACTNPPSSGVASCTALSNALSSNGTDAHVETALLVTGSVLVAIGVVTVLWPNLPQVSTSGLAPAVGPHVAGLQWSGSF